MLENLVGEAAPSEAERAEVEARPELARHLGVTPPGRLARAEVKVSHCVPAMSLCTSPG
jgi:hypothetical protein